MSGEGAELLELLDRVVAQAAPDEAVEAYGIDATETTVRAYGGEVESLSSARSRGVAVRLVRDGRVGFAYSADLTEAALDQALTDARDNAAAASSDEANGLPDAAPIQDLPGLAVDGFRDVPPARKVELALALEAAVRRAGG